MHKALGYIGSLLPCLYVTFISPKQVCPVLRVWLSVRCLQTLGAQGPQSTHVSCGRGLIPCQPGLTVGDQKAGVHLAVSCCRPAVMTGVGADSDY